MCISTHLTKIVLLWRVLLNTLFVPMLPNIFKVKQNLLLKHSIEKVKVNYVNKSKHFPSLVKEWYSSIYAYNRNIVRLLPALDKSLYKLISSYFNLYNIKFDKKIKSKRLRIRKRRPSTNRFLISKPNFKHTSDKLNIIVYTYNRRNKYYLNKMSRSTSLISACLHPVRKNKVFVPFMKNLKNKMIQLEFQIKRRTNMLLRKIVSYMNVKKHVSLLKHINKIYILYYVKKHMRREIISMRYKQSINLEQSKYEKQYLLPLIALVQKLYVKKVVFNIVNLKYFYNSSSIFSNAVMGKLRNRKNRPARVLKTSLNTFRLPRGNKLTVYNDMYNREKFIQNLSLESLIMYDNRFSILGKVTGYLHKKDMLDELLLNINHDKSIKLITPEINLNEIIKSLKHKFTTGLRVEVAGRLTKRNKAERSVFKLGYKGSIKNADSSHKNLPAVLLRGYAESNLMYTQCRSRLRIGAFGLKTWVSSS